MTIISPSRIHHGMRDQLTLGPSVNEPWLQGPSRVQYTWISLPRIELCLDEPSLPYNDYRKKGEVLGQRTLPGSLMTIRTRDFVCTHHSSRSSGGRFFHARDTILATSVV